jgi:hypothetical protein
MGAVEVTHGHELVAALRPPAAAPGPARSPATRVTVTIISRLFTPIVSI